MDRKEAVRRFVDEAVNGGRDEVIDELFTSDMTGWVGVLRSGLKRATELVLPLALPAAVAALFVPSEILAERSDFLLAGLVLLTALCIAPSVRISRSLA